MKQIKSTKQVTIPKGVTIDIDARRVVVKGPKGELKRNFRHMPISIYKTDGGKKIELALYFAASKQLTNLQTVASHIDNMITGVTKGFNYFMRLVYAHFPINATIVNGGKRIEVRNFLGEKTVRAIDMLGDTKIDKTDVKDELKLTGNDITEVSRSAALIHQSCLVKKKDIRRFLDGIYVSAKGPIMEE